MSIGTTKVEELINDMDTWLKENRSAYYAELLPGAKPDELKDFQETLGIKLPETFSLLYSWRNGQKSGCSQAIHENNMFMSLEDIAEAKEELDGMMDSDFEEGFWNDKWVPFLSNGGGDHLCLDMTPNGKARIIQFWHDDDPRKEQFASLDEWLEKLIKSMKDGSYEVF